MRTCSSRKQIAAEAPRRSLPGCGCSAASATATDTKGSVAAPPGPAATGHAGGGTGSGGAAGGAAKSFDLFLLQRQQNIRNQEENIERLRSNLFRLEQVLIETRTRAGDPTVVDDILRQDLGVAQARQALFNSESTLLNAGQPTRITWTSLRGGCWACRRRFAWTCKTTFSVPFSSSTARRSTSSARSTMSQPPLARFASASPGTSRPSPRQIPSIRRTPAWSGCWSGIPSWSKIWRT